MSNPRSEDATKIIFEGVTVSTLSDIFNLLPKDVSQRISGKVTPVTGREGSFVRYRIRDAAPYLIDQQIDMDDLLKNLSPSKWPPTLQDAYWKAMNNKQKYEENRGDLWRTERVYEVVTAAFKEIRLTILMFADTIANRTDLSAAQRAIIQELGDGLLSALRLKIVEEFAFYEAPDDEHGDSTDYQQIKMLGNGTKQETPEVDPFE